VRRLATSSYREQPTFLLVTAWRTATSEADAAEALNSPRIAVGPAARSVDRSSGAVAGCVPPGRSAEPPTVDSPLQLTDKSARRLDEILRAWRRSLASEQFGRIRYLMDRVPCLSQPP
jgi:hypothetical protein